MRAKMAMEKKLKELETQLADAKATGAPLDEDLVREHMLTSIQTYVAKTITQLALLQSESEMLRQMMEHRARPSRERGSESSTGTSADGHATRKAGHRPPEAPITITKEMVAKMSATGGSINRADFQLVTKGYGPIGAPTMTMDELAKIEMENMVKPSAPVVEEFDEDSNEAADLATYKARAADVENDYIRRGDGNKIGMG